MDKDRGLISGLYARVSTGRQEEQETIDSQLAEIKVRIQDDGNILTQENVFSDDGWTGEMLQRPGLDAMRDAAMEGRFDVLYVYDRGRLSRVFAYQEVIIEELLNKGIKFVTLHDVQANTPEERVLQAMQGVFHEYERVKIVERFRRGKLYKARNGVIINAQALYGYSYIPKMGNEPAKIILNEEEAEIVRKIFYWVGVERISLREVRKRLHNLGVPPRKGKQEIWTSGPLTRLLRCETYITGIAFYNKSEAVVAKNPKKQAKYRKVKRTSRRMRPREEWIPVEIPKILEEEWLFEKVQQVLVNNKRYASKRKKYDYLLSGLVYCQCGKRRAGDGSSATGHHYYRCAERIYKYPLVKTCKAQGVNAAVLDGLLWQELNNFLGDKETMKKQASDWIVSQNSRLIDVGGEKSRLNKSADAINEEEMRYAKAYGAGAVEFDQFQELMNELKRKKKSLQSQIEQLEVGETGMAIDEKELDILCDYAVMILKEIDGEDKKKVIQDIISKVIIYDSGEVEVKGYLPGFNHKLGYVTESRDCGVTERGEVDLV